MVLLQFSWRRGSKDSRGQGFKCLFSKDFISVFNILSISAMSFFAVPNSPFSMKPKSPCREPLSRTAANKIWNHTDSLEDYSFDLPELATTNREMIQNNRVAVHQYK